MDWSTLIYAWCLVGLLNNFIVIGCVWLAKQTDDPELQFLRESTITTKEVVFNLVAAILMPFALLSFITLLVKVYWK